MNMTQVEDGQEKSFDIAAISGVVYDHARLAADPYGFGESQELIMTWIDDRAILSAPFWDRASWDQRLTLTRAVLAIFSCIPNAEAATLRWLFSGIDVERADAGDLLARWEDDRVPPVMTLIEFLVEDRVGQRYIRTIGLVAFVGHEVEAMIDEDNAELSRMVGRLAQEVLQTGPVNRNSITGPDGGKYRLKHLQDARTVCPSIQVSPENT